jgi:hypothetical protein
VLLRKGRLNLNGILRHVFRPELFRRLQKAALKTLSRVGSEALPMKEGCNPTVTAFSLKAPSFSNSLNVSLVFNLVLTFFCILSTASCSFS